MGPPILEEVDPLEPSTFICTHEDFVKYFGDGTAQNTSTCSPPITTPAGGISNTSSPTDDDDEPDMYAWTEGLSDL